jgi:hypothetical protein
MDGVDGRARPSRQELETLIRDALRDAVRPLLDALDGDHARPSPWTAVGSEERLEADLAAMRREHRITRLWCVALIVGAAIFALVGPPAFSTSGDAVSMRCANGAPASPTPDASMAHR